MNNILAGRSVLVVEDEVFIGWMLETMIGNLGCKVVGVATRIDEALTLIETLENIDLVVLDFSLNGQKCYPVADALMERGIPFAFSTGYNKDNFPEKYQSIPMLQKPYREHELGDALMKLLTPQNRGRRKDSLINKKIEAA